MKKTPLYQEHVDLGAKMVPFAGFEMPVSYSGIKEEHFAVREDVGVFDVSHMGEFYVRGPKAKDLINYVTSNDVDKLKPGKAQYSCFPNEKGGIVDDLIVYMRGEEDYMLVVNGACLDKDWAWVSKQNENFGAELINASDDIALLAVQGPNASDLVQKLTQTDLSNIPFYHFEEGGVAGIDNVIISNTGYTGAGGFELYVPAENAAHVWKAVVEGGAKPTGLGCRDTLRLEMGYCLYGNDITDETSPIEAGLGWITKVKKECDFISKAHFTAQKADGVKRKLSGMVMLERGIPRNGYRLLNESGDAIGIITSGTQSPSLDKAIALAYVDLPYNEIGTKVFVEIRNRNIPAEITSLPFYKSK